MTRTAYASDVYEMANFLGSDFKEYNARPYARLMAKALENLYDFSEDRAIRRGARLVLDYISAKFAASSSQLRRSVPFRRLPENATGSRFFHAAEGERTADEETFRFIQLAGVSDVLRNEQHGIVHNYAANPMLVTSTSGYQVPDLVLDMIREQGGKQSYFQAFHHEGYELYTARSTYLISAGGVFRPGWDADAISSLTIDAATTALVGDPILGTLLGETLVKSVIDGVAARTKPAIATTLMPVRGALSGNELIRVEGAADPTRRNNTCVHPLGFACGLNPVIPDAVQARVYSWMASSL